jgi:hypothetical protein
MSCERHIHAGRFFRDKKHVDIGRKLTWAHEVSPLGLVPGMFHMLPCSAATGCAWDEELLPFEVIRHPSSSTGTGTRRTRREWARSSSGWQWRRALISDNRLARDFTAVSGNRYMLHPETMKSMFVLWRATGR